MSGDIKSRMRLMNQKESTVILYSYDIKRKWILDKNYWNDGGIWIDNKNWND